MVLENINVNALQNLYPKEVFELGLSEYLSLLPKWEGDESKEDREGRKSIEIEEGCPPKSQTD